MAAKTFKKARLICHIVAVSDKLHPHTVNEHFSFVAEICTGSTGKWNYLNSLWTHPPTHQKSANCLIHPRWDWPWDDDRNISWMLVIYLVELQNVHKGIMACNLKKGILQAAKHSRSLGWWGSWQFSMYLNGMMASPTIQTANNFL